MKKLLFLFFTLTVSSYTYSQVTSFNNLPNSKVFSDENIEAVVYDVLCVKNNTRNRATFVLYFKDEAISNISVGSMKEYCFELGNGEGSWDWKVSKGSDGTKEKFIGRSVTFYY